MNKDAKQIISNYLNDQDFGIGSLYTMGKAVELINILNFNGFVIRQRFETPDVQGEKK